VNPRTAYALAGGGGNKKSYNGAQEKRKQNGASEKSTLPHKVVTTMLAGIFNCWSSHRKAGLIKDGGFATIGTTEAQRMSNALGTEGLFFN
jgi:hypothetical protein